MTHARLAAVDGLEHLTAEQRQWLVEDERRWRRAHEIATAHPGIDVGGIYRVLRNLEKPPSARLKAALDHGRLRGVLRR
jgi:hypothetical protein